MKNSLRISPSTERPDERVIADFEVRVGAQLPEAFKTFLIHFGDAKPADNLYNNNPKLGVDRFLSVIGKHTIQHELEIVNGTEDRIGKNFIPIANDGSGNYFLLNLIDGSIWFWQHDVFEHDDAYTKLSDDFEIFLEHLTPAGSLSKSTIPYKVLKNNFKRNKFNCGVDNFSVSGGERDKVWDVTDKGRGLSWNKRRSD